MIYGNHINGIMAASVTVLLFFRVLMGHPVPQFPHSPSVSQLPPVSYDHSAIIPNRPAKAVLLLRDDAQKPAQNPDNGHRPVEIASFLRDDAAATRAEHRGKFRQKTMEKT